MTDTPPDIVVPAAFEHALRLLDKHYVAADELTDALIAINSYNVDLEDDAIAAIENERMIRRVSADAIANALAIQCRNPGPRHLSKHVLNATELHNRQCNCGARVVIEEVKQ